MRTTGCLCVTRWRGGSSRREALTLRRQIRNPIECNTDRRAHAFALLCHRLGLDALGQSHRPHAQRGVERLFRRGEVAAEIDEEGAKHNHCI